MTAHKLALMMFSLTAALACSIDGGGDDDDSSGSASEGDTGLVEGSDQQCIDTPTVLALAEVSAGGFSGEQVLAGRLGAGASTLTFASEPTTLSDEWKGKQLPVNIQLSHSDGEVRWIDSEVNPDFDDSGNLGGLVDCVDRMEIDVEIGFVSEAKEFDEQRDAVLTASAADRADVQAELLPPGLAGSLDVSTLYEPGDPATEVTGLWIFATWQGTQAGGSIMHEVRLGEGEDAAAGFGPLASWGDAVQP